MRFTPILLLLTACGGEQAAPVVHGGVPAWQIGPVIDGKNYSVGMPASPTSGPPGLFYIDIPAAPAGPHYVTVSHGSLTNAKQMVLRYTVEADTGAEIRSVSHPDQPGIVVLYFQRSGDDWSGVGKGAMARWWSAPGALTAGEHEIIAPLNGVWTSVFGESSILRPAEFAAAKANANQVGFTLGGGGDFGHGVSATGKARLIVTYFGVE